MAYIAPDSDIYVLKGVPLDKDYNHTLYQTNATAQYNTFYAYRKYIFTDQSYQRAGKGKLRIARLADDMYDCNYLMFRNTAFGNKWFYAFIDKVDYVNNNASELYYTIDDMQSWYFDYELGSCFVEREHTLTDVVGENLVQEDVATGDYIVTQDWEYKFPTDMPFPVNIERNTDIYPDTLYYLVVYYALGSNNAYIYDMTYNSTTYEYTYEWANIAYGNDGVVNHNIFLGCNRVHVPLRVSTFNEQIFTRVNILKLIKELNDHSCQIIDMIQVPSVVYWYDETPDALRPSNEYERSYSRAESTRFYDSTHTNFYTPKNKKMMCYPYRKIVVSNNAGSVNEYRWEQFETTTSAGLKSATFKLQGVAVPVPEIMLSPTSYRGLSVDYENGLILNDFPKASWGVDSFGNWWSQNKESFILSTISSAIIGTISAGLKEPSVPLNPVGLMETVASSIGTFVSHKNAPDYVGGQISVSSIRTAQNRIGYHLYDMAIEKDSAEVIDDYFTMFGYAIKKVKVPNVRLSNVTLRPHWNYIKTKGCVIHSASGKGLPSDAESKIATIYDKGITFWTNASEVGDYSLDNSPSA